MREFHFPTDFQSFWRPGDDGPPLIKHGSILTVPTDTDQGCLVVHAIFKALLEHHLKNKKRKPRKSCRHLFLLPPPFTHLVCFEGRKSAPLQQHGEGDLHTRALPLSYFFPCCGVLIQSPTFCCLHHGCPGCSERGGCFPHRCW